MNQRLTYVVRVSSDAPPLTESVGDDVMVGEEGFLRRLLLLVDEADLAFLEDEDDDAAATEVVSDDTERSKRSKEDLNSMNVLERTRKEKNRIETLTWFQLKVMMFMISENVTWNVMDIYRRLQWTEVHLLI
jgi:hypothetical protein